VLGLGPSELGPFQERVGPRCGWEWNIPALATTRRESRGISATHAASLPGESHGRRLRRSFPFLHAACSASKRIGDLPLPPLHRRPGWSWCVGRHLNCAIEGTRTEGRKRAARDGGCRDPAPEGAPVVVPPWSVPAFAYGLFDSCACLFPGVS
jgi:hypothetical protein